MPALIGKWGNSLALRLPAHVAEAARLREGDPVVVEARDGDVVIRRADREATLVELFGGRTPEAWRAAYAGAWDWGPDLGREIVAE